MQVYAVSDKAEDVRGVVTRMNSERGDRDEAAIDRLAADPAAAQQAPAWPVAERQSAAQPPWNDFLTTQVRHCHSDAACGAAANAVHATAALVTPMQAVKSLCQHELSTQPALQRRLISAGATSTVGRGSA